MNNNAHLYKHRDQLIKIYKNKQFEYSEVFLRRSLFMESPGQVFDVEL